MPTAFDDEIKEFKNKKFDLARYVQTRLGIFWKQGEKYVKKHNIDRSNSRKKHHNWDEMFSVIDKIIPALEPNSLAPEVETHIDNIYAIFLYYRTPREIRNRAFEQYMRLLPKLNKDLFGERVAIRFLVPYPLFIPNPEGSPMVQSLRQITQGILESGDISTEEEALSQLQEYLGFIKDSFKKDPQTMGKLLFDSVFAIVYYQIAANSGYTTHYRWFDMPPLACHREILKILVQIIGSDVSCFFIRETNIKTIIGIIEITATFCDLECSLMTLEFWNYVIKSKPIIFSPLLINSTLILDFGYVIVDIVTAHIVQSPQESEPLLKESLAFFTNYIFIVESNEYFKRTMEIIQKLIDRTNKNEYAAAHVFQAILGRVLLTNKKTDQRWNRILQLVETRPLFSASASMYSEYLATLTFRNYISTSIDDVKSICALSCRYEEESKETTDHSINAQNIGVQLDDPLQFVVKYFKLDDTDYDQYKNIMECLPLVQLQFADDLVDGYLEKFDVYLDASQPNIVFDVIYAFYSTLERLDHLPMDVVVDHCAIAKSAFPRLIDAISCRQGYIKRKSLELLTRLLKRTEVLAHLTETQLNSIYDAIQESLEELDCQREAFELGTHLLHINPKGSFKIVEPLLKFVESLEDWTNGIDMFMCTYPLLKPYTERIIGLIDRFVEYTAYENLLAIASHLLVQQIVSHEANFQQIRHLLEFICKGFDSFSFDCLDVFASFSCCFEHMNEDCSVYVIDHFLISLEKALNEEHNIEWIYEATPTLGYLIIRVSTLYNLQAYYDRYITLVQKALTDNEEDDELFLILKVCLEMIGVYNKRYPFPHYHPTITHGELFKNKELSSTAGLMMDSTTPLLFYEKQDTACVSSFTNVGAFEWGFEPYPLQPSNQPEISPLSVPLTSSEKSVEKLIAHQREQSFQKHFDDVIASFETDFGDAFELPDYAELPEFPIMRNESDAIHPIQFNKCFQATSSSVVLSTGMIDPMSIETLSLFESNRDALNICDDISRMDMRERYEVGVIYYGSDEFNVYKSTFEATSEGFKDLLKGLGWVVDSDNHRGFTGDLKKDSFVYFSDLEHNLAYHVVPLFTSDDDYEKRLILRNDIVFVVYCDNSKEFDPTAVTKEFGLVGIMLYPEQDDFVRMEVYEKKVDGSISPLWNRCLLDKKSTVTVVQGLIFWVYRHFWRSRFNLKNELKTIEGYLKKLRSQVVPLTKRSLNCIREIVTIRSSP